MPNTIFTCQTTVKKAKFLEFGLKHANLATLVLARSAGRTGALMQASKPNQTHILT